MTSGRASTIPAIILLLAGACAAPPSRQGTSAPAAGTPGAELVREVLDVDLAMLRSYPPQLQVQAVGQVPTLGYTDPELVVLNPNVAPADGVYELLFYATPPAGVAGQALADVTALEILSNIPPDLRGVRVFGRGGQCLETFLSAADAAAFGSRECSQ